jgi:hypothetical protein
MSRRPRSGRRPPSSPDNRLFHPKHYVSTFWTVVAAGVTGIVMFGGGITYRHLTSPPRVIATSDTTARTFVVDTAVQAYLRQLVAIQARSDSAAAVSRQPESLNPRSVLEGMQRSAVRPTISSSTSPGISPASPDRSWAIEALQSDPIPPKEPRFEFPPVARGWGQGNLGSYGDVVCPRRRVPTGQLARAAIRVSQGVIAKSTPLIIRVYGTSAEGRPTLILDEQYELRPVSLLALPLPLPSGEYTLDIGLYMLADLNQRYPTYHRVSCPLTLVEPSSEAS